MSYVLLALHWQYHQVTVKHSWFEIGLNSWEFQTILCKYNNIGPGASKIVSSKIDDPHTILAS